MPPHALFSNLASAVAKLHTANTPSFFVRSLKSDPAVYAAYVQLKADVALAALEASLMVRPKTQEDLVRPYVLLAALALHRHAPLLERAARYPAPYHPWYGFAASMLRSEMVSSSSQSVILGPPVTAAGASTHRGAANIHQQITIPT